MRIGIDLGGTKIEGILLAPDGRVLTRERRETPRGDYPATLKAVAAFCATLKKQAGGKATIGIGMPGAPSPATGRIKNANSTWLIGKPLQADLEASLGQPVRLANDADCFALSEAADGAGAGARSLFGVILGTGVGGGLVYEGRLINGPNAIAGEWGHNPLPAPQEGELPGPDCYCGRRGCIETWLSGPGLAEDHFRITGEKAEPQALEARAASGDAAAAATLARYADRLARALSGVINIFDPEVIVLGGGLSNLTLLYEDVPARWARYIFSDQVATRLKPNLHGDSSGVRGAAWLWSEAEAAAL